MSSSSPVDNFDYNKAVEDITEILKEHVIYDFAIFIHKEVVQKEIHIRIAVDVVEVEKLDTLKERLNADLQELRYMGLHYGYEYSKPHINIELEVKK